MYLAIQNGNQKPTINDYLNVKIIKENILQENLLDYKGLIILGGNISLLNPISKHLQDCIKLTEMALSMNIPVIGICLGSQILAKVLGCELKRIGLKMDTNLIWNSRNYFRCHHDKVILNSKIELLLEQENIPYLWKYKNCWGIQFHPDMNQESIEKYTFGISNFVCNTDIDDNNKYFWNDLDL